MPNVLTPLQKFQLRCETRAALWQLHELSLHDAVDELEKLRRELGIDADTAQAIMAPLFALVRDDLGGRVVR